MAPWTFYNSSGEAMIIDGGVQASAAVITNDLTVNSGNVVIGTAGKGIDFSAQTATSTGTTTAELLDHYETGTWTPILYDNSRADESQAYTTQTGKYRRIGNTVHIWYKLVMSSLGSLDTGQPAAIFGLPFTSANDSIVGIGSFGALGGLAITAGNMLVQQVDNNGTGIYLANVSATTGTSHFTIAHLSADGSLNGYICYTV